MSSALMIASSALTAHQRNMDRISHNISNAQTPGYVRQTASYQSLEYAGKGQGVLLGDTVRNTNAYAFKRMNDSIAKNAQGRAELPVREGIESRFSPLSSGSVASRVSDYEDALIEYSADPKNPVVQEKVKQNRDAVNAAIGDTQAYLNSSSAAIDNDISNAQSELGELMEQFNEVNRIAGNDPNLNSRRDQLITSISEYVGVNVQKNGEQLNLTTENGSPLTVPLNNIEGAGGRLGGLANAKAKIDDARTKLNSLASSVGGVLVSDAQITAGPSTGPGGFTIDLSGRLSKEANDLAAGMAVETTVFKNRVDSNQAMMNYDVGKYDELTGVDLDKETVDMLATQRAYEAATKVINVDNEMFRSLTSILS